MDQTQLLTLFYIIPIALWVVVLLILLQVWLTRKLEDSLAYLVYLRERKVLFVSLLVGLAGTRAISAAVKVANGFGWVDNTVELWVGIIASIVGALIVFFFAWFLLWKGPSRLPRPLVLDVPEHLTYSLGVLDRAEKEQSRVESAD